MYLYLSFFCNLLYGPQIVQVPYLSSIGAIFEEDQISIRECYMTCTLSYPLFDYVKEVVPCCGVKVPDSVKICRVWTPAILAKLEDSLSMEWQVEEIIT